MEMDQLFRALWDKYTQMTPSAKEIRRLFEERGETVFNDHIAIRTFNDPRVNIDILSVPFVELGYEEKGSYEFKEKKLFAHHYEHPNNPDAPKIFISELQVEKCSENIRTVVSNLLQQADPELLGSSRLLLQGRLWKISFEEYEILRKESEYAAWMYVFGFCANHFTVFVNKLQTLGSLQDVNSLLKDNRFKLNDAGGEIKGSPAQLLEQSSTIADQIPVEFEDGVKNVPGCYYEFARRYPTTDGSLYQGFIAASADKIFESTDVSLAEKAQPNKI